MPIETTIIHSNDAMLFNVFGPLQQFLVAPSDTSGAFGIMRAIVPPSIAIPLHSHADPEVFFVLEGLLEVLRWSGEVSHWVTARPGDVICVPGGIKHGIRNNSTAPTVILLATTPKIYEFFRELGKPYKPGEPAGPPTEEDMRRLLGLAAKYQYWIGSPQENAAISLSGFQQ
jgi:quercetin dioxygenase-like cupin family protein